MSQRDRRGFNERPNPAELREPNLSHQPSPVGLGVVQGERVSRVLGQYKRDNRVLHEVVERAARHLVEVGEILKVGDSSIEPVLLHGREILRLNHVGQSQGHQLGLKFIPVLGERKQTVITSKGYAVC